MNLVKMKNISEIQLVFNLVMIIIKKCTSVNVSQMDFLLNVYH